MVRRVIIFYLLALITTVLLAVFQESIGLPLTQVILPQLGPGFAALIISFFYRKEAITPGFSIDRSILPELGLVAVVPFLLMAGGIFLYHQTGHSASGGTEWWLMLPGMIIGAVGEELGWRGYLMPELMRKIQPLRAGILTGILWGLWHLGNYGYGLWYMMGLIMFTTGASLILFWIMRYSGNHVGLAAVFHVSINLGFYLLAWNSMSDPGMILSVGVIWLLLATILVVVKLQDFQLLTGD